MSLVLAPDKKAQDAIRKAAEAERRDCDSQLLRNDRGSEKRTTNHEPVDEPRPPTTADTEPRRAEQPEASEPATPQTSGDE